MKHKYLYLITILMLFFYQIVLSGPIFAISTASMRLPSTLTTKTGDIISVPLTVDAGGQSLFSADVSISFDKNLLTLVAIEPVAQSLSNFKLYLPANSGIFDQNSVVQRANITGLVEFSAATIDLSQSRQLPAFTGIIQLANLKFQSKNSGTTDIIIKMSSGNTTDSNLVVLGTIPTDILTDISQVTSLRLTVSGTTTAIVGDADGDNDVDLVDFSIWKSEYLTGIGQRANFDHLGGVDLADFVIWKSAYLRI